MRRNFRVIMWRRYQTPSTFRASSTASPIYTILHDGAVSSFFALTMVQVWVDNSGPTTGKAPRWKLALHGDPFRILERHRHWYSTLFTPSIFEPRDRTQRPPTNMT